MKILLNTKIYPKEAILNTCYLFLKQAYFYLDMDKKGEQISVFIEKKGSFFLKNLKKDFLNKLLQSSLRYEISKKNKKIREYIIGRALASILPQKILDVDTQELNYKNDPLGIRTAFKK